MISMCTLVKLSLLSSVVAFALRPPPTTNHLVLGRSSLFVSHIPSHQRSLYRLQCFPNEDDKNNADDSTKSTPTSSNRLSRTDMTPHRQHKHHLILSRRSSLRQCIHKSSTTMLLLLSSSGTRTATAVAASDEKVRDNKTKTNSTGSSSSSSTRNTKPYAPLENLLPATRALVLINTAVETAQNLSNKKEQQQRQQLLQTLKDLILVESKQPSTYFKTAAEAAASKTYLQIDTWQTWKKARQSETSAKSSFLDGSQFSINPFTSLNEAAEQWGERNQFSRLQKQQLALERKNPMRAAFNAYTNNLLFGDRYMLTADPAVKSRLIRDDRLPDVTSVVRSDLDLRDLYRNQVLTAWEDATAELEYQLKMTLSTEPFDATELLALLQQAQSSCQEWFKFVPEQDMKEALAVVQNEQRNQLS